MAAHAAAIAGGNATIDGDQATAAITQRRSSRSDSRPIGTWKTTPPMITAAMKVEIGGDRQAFLAGEDRSHR